MKLVKANTEERRRNLSEENNMVKHMRMNPSLRPCERLKTIEENLKIMINFIDLY